MTPPYPELVAALRREGTALLSAGRLGLDAAVPTCGDWRVGRLLAHVGRVYRYATANVVERTTADPGRQPGLPDGADPVQWCEESLEELVAAFAGADADTPAWNWSPGPPTAAWWARRMAHESAVHRWDAQHAHGYPQRIEADLAADGIDELVDALLPRLLSRGGGPPERAHGRLRLETADDGRAWDLVVDGDGVRRGRDGTPDVTVRGSASQLELLLYGRVAPSDVEVSGDATRLAAWQQDITI